MNPNHKITATPSGVSEHEYRKALNKIKRRNNNNIPLQQQQVSTTINENNHIIEDDTSNNNILNELQDIGNYNYNIINNERQANKVPSNRRMVVTNDRNLSNIQMNPSNTTTTNSTTIDSAALQADMARKYNLTAATSNIGNVLRVNRSNTVSSGHSSNRTSSYQSMVTHPPNICGSCQAINEHSHSICMKCGYYMNCIIQPVETLAQRRGLVPAPPKIDSITQLNWQIIEFNIRKKKDPDSLCPICMEGFISSFVSSQEVLLSCGHIFHQTCLRSFENFVKDGVLSCPMCRMKNYQKKVTNLGSEAYRKVCVKKIQALYRGFQARQLYKIELKLFHRNKKSNEIRRKKYYESEFQTITNKLNQSLTTRSVQVESMISSMDRTLLESQQLDLLFDHMLNSRLVANTITTTDRPTNTYDIDYLRNGNTVNQIQVDAPGAHNYADESDDYYETNINWKEIYQTALLRCPSDCAICMLPIHCTVNYCHIQHSNNTQVAQINSNKRDVILSCSHLFHEHCIGNFEKFVGNMNQISSSITNNSNATTCCPVCRSKYTKKLFRIMN